MFEKITINKCNKCVVGKKIEKGSAILLDRKLNTIRRGNKDAEVLIIQSRYDSEEYTAKFENEFVRRLGIKNYAIVSGLDCSIVDIKGVTQYSLYKHCNTINLEDYPNLKAVVTLGSGLFSITKTKDLENWREFREFVFNQTYFYTEFSSSKKVRVYPLSFYDDMIYSPFNKTFAEKQITSLKGYLRNHNYLDIDYKIHYVDDPNQFLKDNSNHELCAWDTETSSLKHFDSGFRVGCLTLCFDGVNGYYLPFDKINIKILNRFFNRTKILIGANGSFDIKAMLVSGVQNSRVDEDIILLYRMLNTARHRNNVGALAWLIGFGGYDNELKELVSKNKIKNYLDIPESLLVDYAVLDAIVTYKLYTNAMNNLVPKQESVYRVYKNIVLPVYPAFIDMEMEGIKVDTELLNKLDKKYLIEQNEFEVKIIDFIGKDINISSPEKLARELERMGLPDYGRTEKGVFQTGKDILKQWEKDGYKIAELLLEYRRIKKLREGFVGQVEDEDEIEDNVNKVFGRVESCQPKSKKDKKEDGIVKSMHSDGKIHPSYGIGLTEPARQFCTSPNIQQFPGVEELRKIFDFEDYLFGEFDVSGFHLRLMAFTSGDEAMRDVFLNQSGDLHSMTAVSIFEQGMSLQEFIKLKKEEPYVTYRHRAKGINFGFLYNGSAWVLAPDIELEWSEEEMDNYIDLNNCIVSEDNKPSFVIANDIRNKFMETYKGIPKYAQMQIQTAKQKGYIKTKFGNVRHLPELLYPPSDRANKKQQELYRGLENICTNTEILSMEALMMHIAMKNIYNDFKSKNMKSKLIMMIHDSVGVKIHKDEVKEVETICINRLENFGIDLKGIPIEAECKEIGKYWGA